VAGRIRDEDIAEVREKARIDDVVSGYVTLRNAGGGSMKGLCPFHDEKSPSFHVTPARAFFHCFGCGEGGDVYSFLMKIDGITFTEAVERLADKVGIQLRYEEGAGPSSQPRGPARGRLIEAHKLAAEYYSDKLGTPEALAARQFLGSRGFDQTAAETFGVGFAPRDGEALFRHLRQKGFSPDELVTSGLIGHGRSHYDRFRGRLLWPIREANGEVIGFGARRIFDDDRIEAKYLNTPESPIYKKSHVLYGLDLARREIGRTSQAVVVEGYTDVMACHLAGVGTAVATCGTAFGDDHARVLRRFLHDHEEFRGEVIFTFDGDAAGQKAALRAFGGDQNFVSQTYVAVEPSGMDPCDLRLSQGDEAVRELIARRVPLYRFVLSNVLSRYDLDRADGRVDALREAARLVSSVRDRSKVDAFAREIAASVGVDVEEARAEVRRASARAAKAPDRGPGSAAAADKAAQRSGERVNARPGERAAERDITSSAAPEAPATPSGPPVPDPREPRFALERETLKLVLQHPAVVANVARDVHGNDFTHPTFAAVWEVIAAAGGPARGAQDSGWTSKLRSATTDPLVATALSALSVEPVRSAKEPDTAYVHAHVYKLLELTALRRISDLKSKLQRTNPVDHPVDYNRMFGELVALEQHRRTLRDQSLGG
jgi:DNA primase